MKIQGILVSPIDPFFISLNMDVALIEDDGIKQGCCVMYLYPDGTHCVQKFARGYLLCQDDFSSDDGVLTLMQNKNYSKTEVGLICALCPELISSYPPGFIPASPILVQGICLKDDVLLFIYHPWKYNNNDVSIADAINGNSNEHLLKLMFHCEPCEVEVAKSEIIYFNQISGPRHRSWKSNVLLLEHPQGGKYYESSLLQDNWGECCYLSPELVSKYEFIRWPKESVKIAVDVSMCKNRDLTAKHIGLSKPAVSRGQQVSVLFCLRIYKDSLKDFYLQPLPCSREGNYQEFVPITRKQARHIDKLLKLPMCRDKFVALIHKYGVENGKGTLTFRRMVVSGKTKTKFVVSVVDSPALNYATYAMTSDQVP